MLALLAVWLLLSNLDDLFLDLACLYRWLLASNSRRRRVRIPSEAELDGAPRKRIAIFVPLWREDKVVRQMIEHNLAALRYEHFDFFIGVYPNDELTRAAAQELEGRFRNVHVALCPHDGPTCKADNLNWIFQRMLDFESARGARFDLVMTHDAEDLIHPDSLRWVNYYGAEFDMTQVPVLPFPTPGRELVHGVYCDEFADFQSRELPVRHFLGGFLPSCGVGTAFSRRALERLAAAHSNRIFEPKSLTEDYEMGFRLRRLGCSQLFLPILRRNGTIIATRGYFPRRFRAAVKQRTRWVTGIALQSWELNGWRETLGQLYWLWRDRKGLISNLAGPVANMAFLIGAGRWFLEGMRGDATRLLLSGESWIIHAFTFSIALQVVHLALRARFSAAIYGWKFACMTPARVLLGNLINWMATASAIYRYCRAKVKRQPLVWLKTEHAYPNRAALVSGRKPLGEILAGSQYLSGEELKLALSTQPSGVRIGEHLARLGKITEEELYECLSLQQNLEFHALKPPDVSVAATRALPAKMSRKWKVLSFKVDARQLFVAGPNPPTEQMNAELRRLSSLEIRFHLVTPENFDKLQREFLPEPALGRLSNGRRSQDQHRHQVQSSAN